MNHKQIIETLRKEIKLNPAADAFFHVCGLRKRARNVITTIALGQKMRAAGFEYPADAYIPVLKMLADLGVGTLKTNNKGKVTALTDIKITLQSLGRAAVGESGHLRPFKKRNKYAHLRVSPNPKAAADRRDMNLPVYLMVTINGKSIPVPVPAELTPEEIAGLITRFQYKSGP